MVDNSRKPVHHNDDEIDLKELFKLAGEFFGNVGRGILKSAIFLKNLISRWYKLIVTFTIIGVLAGYSFKFITSSYYSTSAQVNSKFLKGNTFIKEFEKLNSLAKSDDEKAKQLLARHLGILVDQAKTITEVGAFHLNDYNHIYESMVLSMSQESADSLRMEDAMSGESFMIEIGAESDAIEAIALKEGIQKYFQKNSFVAASQEVEKQNLMRERSELLAEMKNLDSLNIVLKDVLKGQLKDSNTSSSSNFLTLDAVQDKVKSSGDLSIKVIKEKLEMQNRIGEIEKEIALSDALVFVNDFEDLSKVKVSGASRALLGLQIALSIVLVIIVLVELNKFLSAKEKELKA
ncbi:hypothetical protein V6R21_17990 [Limibacter armeniacum]|uniref:hypothetical protein n=1 Tax=Limibacter armeniacum TaxID=466084 RepID=UPI002FE556FF